MCGGKGTRMQDNSTEKPLIKINNIPMVERVILALVSSCRFDRIIAVVSPNVPETKRFLKSKSIDIIETSGESFSQDLSSFLSKLKPTRILVLPADLPLMDAKIVSEIASIAQRAPAVSIAIEKEFVESIGVKPSVVLFDRYCHSGITIFDTAQIVFGREGSSSISSSSPTIEERYVVINKIEIAVNVNTKEEAELAEKLLVQRF